MSTTPHQWPDREEWARRRRTVYTDDVANVRDQVSQHLPDYATAEQVDAAITELRTYWRQLGKDVRAANAAARNAFPRWGDWRGDPAGYLDDMKALDAEAQSTLERADELAQHRKDVNGQIRDLAAGFLPRRTRWIRTSTPVGASPVLAGIVGRYHASQAAAEAAFVERIRTAPIDDAAWQKELEKRAELERYFRDGPTVHRQTVGA